MLVFEKRVTGVKFKRESEELHLINLIFRLQGCEYLEKNLSEHE